MNQSGLKPLAVYFSCCLVLVASLIGCAHSKDNQSPDGQFQELPQEGSEPKIGAPSEKKGNNSRGQPGSSSTHETSITNPEYTRKLITGEATPPDPEQAKEELESGAKNWFFGPGFGSSVSNIALMIVFPPYAIYLLGNAGLQLAGYEPWYVTDELSPEQRSATLNTYNEVMSVPGKFNSLIFDEEFREPTPVYYDIKLDELDDDSE